MSVAATTLDSVMDVFSSLSGARLLPLAAASGNDSRIGNSPEANDFL